MKKFFYTAIQTCSAVALMAFAGAAVAQKTMDDFTVSPKVLSTGVEPMMMLAMSNDHQLYLKAYGDFDSVAGFDPAEEYIGYFDSSYCYTYTDTMGASSAYFAMDKQASLSSANAKVPSYCNETDDGNLWSGNFLNWASMTRIDVLRKLLYGGKRAVANTTRTILERSHLPNDAHSFAKYYNQSDVKQLVPLAVLGTQAAATDGSGGVTFCNTTIHDQNKPTSYNSTNPPLLRAIAGNYALWASGERSQCLYQDEFLPGGFRVGVAIDIDTSSVSLTQDEIRVIRDAFRDQVTANLPVIAGETDEQRRNRVRAITNTRTDAEVARRNRAASQSLVKTRTGEIFKGLNFLPSHAAPIAPTAPFTKLDFTLKVEACPANKAAQLKDCKQYPSGDWRPIGALQEHGESEKIKFGLISGSYEQNKTGGFLRKNIGFITDEIDPVTGDFIIPASGESIIAHIDALRIAGWDFTQAAYVNECNFGLSTFNDGDCRDWGNPLSEIMQEAYSYFAGKKPTATFTNTTGDNPVAENSDPKDSTITEFQTSTTAEGKQVTLPVNVSVQTARNIPVGITKAPWKPVIDESNYCANLSVLGLNTSVQSYDNDQVNLAAITANGVTAGVSVKSLTKEIGQLEGFDDANKQFFVGSAGDANANDNGLCTAKKLSDLSKTTGSCPEGPRLEGGWNLAGLARYAYENDINSFNNVTENLGTIEELQTVETYGIDFAGTIPVITLPTDSPVSISPACENIGVGNCAIVDFRRLAGNKNSSEGAFYINYEDSEQGGDYDQDLHGILRYEVIGGSLVNITTEIIGESSTGQMGFGYVITGVNGVNGFTAHSGINGYNRTACGSTGMDTDGCNVEDGPSTRSYTLVNSNNAPTLLPTPLELATKYGNSNPDGAYFKTDNPEGLRQGLQALGVPNGRKIPASTSGVVASLGNRGGNIILHTFFTPLIESADESKNESVNWVGSIGALFIDEDDRLREDTNGNGALNDADRIVEFEANPDREGQPLLTFITNNADGTQTTTTRRPLSELKYVWSASDALDAMTKIDTNARSIYTRIPTLSNATNSTAINTNVVTGDVQDFTPTLFNDAANAAMLGGAKPANLVKFIRGEEVAGMRNRTVDGKKHLLGDIIGSSPLLVGTPEFSYDVEFGDASYREFKEKYAAEPAVVYAAANDGMIHAFDAGSFDFTTKKYTPSTAAGLGAELWAYIPFNLLPHLQWLSSPFYTHVPYVDGFLGTFDVKIFPPESKVHVGGWGTILVAGTGQGGGHFPIHINNDNTADVTTRPAYVVLDVTDRKGPPKLIAEISHEQLGFTAGKPDVIRKVDLADPNNNQWFLVFGSGPRGDDDTTRRDAQLNFNVALSDPSAGAADKQARLFTFNLTPTPNNGSLSSMVINQSTEGAFVGGVNGMDWNRNYEDNAIYFGLVEGNAANPTGKLMRAAVDFTGSSLTLTPSVMLDTAKPIFGRPTTLIDFDNNYWVFAGTGRFFTQDEDKLEHNGNLYVGIKERKPDTNAFSGDVKADTFVLTNLLNTSGIRVFKDGRIENFDDLDGQPVTSISALRDIIESGDSSVTPAKEYDGWYFMLGGNERQVSEADHSAGVLFFNSLQANGPVNQAQSCSIRSGGFAYEIDFLSGVPSPRSNNVVARVFDNNTGADVSKVQLGTPIDGAAAGEGNSKVPYIPGPPAKIDARELPDTNVPSQRHSWREIPLPR